MKKYLSLQTALLISGISSAQDNKNRASIIGSEIGRVVGFVLVAALVIWGISRLIKRNN